MITDQSIHPVHQSEEAETEDLVQVSIVHGYPTSPIAGSLQQAINRELQRLHQQGHQFISLSLLARGEDVQVFAGIIYRPRPGSME